MAANEINEKKGEVMMKVTDVADYLRLSEAKVYRMANRGQIPALRLGKTWRFNKKILDDWIRRETKGGDVRLALGHNNKEVTP